MKSRISIDMDWDNQPIIRIEYNPSDDVRDKMVKRFQERFGSHSCWALFFFDGNTMDAPNRNCIIRPIIPEDLEKSAENMKLDAELFKTYQHPTTESKS